MTKQEFETLTGRMLDGREYQEVEAMYNCNENMSKMEFCELFVKMNLDEYAISTAERVSDLEQEVARLQRELDKVRGVLDYIYRQKKKAEGKLAAIANVMEGGAA
ncbi:MAG: hypothetical protein J6I49_03410 [Bacteroidales bacterium]|nr:hypothetical protein [Bacteroidales bacterium]